MTDPRAAGGYCDWECRSVPCSSFLLPWQLEAPLSGLQLLWPRFQLPGRSVLDLRWPGRKENVKTKVAWLRVVAGHGRTVEACTGEESGAGREGRGWQWERAQVTTPLLHRSSPHSAGTMRDPVQLTAMVLLQFQIERQILQCLATWLNYRCLLLCSYWQPGSMCVCVYVWGEVSRLPRSHGPVGDLRVRLSWPACLSSP